MKIGKYIFLVLLFVACTTQSKKGENTSDSLTVAADSPSAESETSQNPFKLETYLVQGKVSGDEVQTISESSVLVVNPTEDQIQQMIDEFGEEDFGTIADDASFYQANALMLIDSMNIPKVNAEKPFALLVGETSPYTLDLRKEGAPGWMIILFHKKKAPEIIPAIDLNREILSEYFELK